MDKQVLSMLATLFSWLSLCALSPYSIWRMIISPHAGASMAMFVLFQAVVAVILIIGMFCCMTMLVSEGGLLLIALLAISILAVLIGSLMMWFSQFMSRYDLWDWLQPITQSLPSSLTHTPDTAIAIAMEAVLILALIPYLISSVIAVVLIASEVRYRLF